MLAKAVLGVLLAVCDAVAHAAEKSVAREALRGLEIEPPVGRGQVGAERQEAAALHTSRVGFRAASSAVGLGRGEAVVGVDRPAGGAGARLAGLGVLALRADVRGAAQADLVVPEPALAALTVLVQARGDEVLKDGAWEVLHLDVCLHAGREEGKRNGDDK